jgi:hypothetical protein
LSESSESQRCRVSTVHVRRFQMSLIVFGLTLYIFATTEAFTVGAESPLGKFRWRRNICIASSFVSTERGYSF